MKESKEHPGIMVISPSNFPGTTGDYANYFELIRGISHKGFNVHLICPLHSDGRSFDESLRKQRIQVIRIPLRPPRLADISRSGMGISVLFKLFAFLAIEICIVLYTIAVESPKICLIRHSLLTLPLAPLLRYFRIRSLADGEILAYDLKDILHLPPYTMNIVKRLENLQLYDFFKVSTKSQSDILAKAGFPSSHILLAGIGMEISKVPRYELAGIRPVTYGYFGSMEKWQGVDFLIRSFSKVVEKEKSALLYLIGEGSLTEELRRKTMDLGISSNILFCSSVSREQLWEEYFRLFRVAVIPRPAFGGKSALIPMKLVEALAAGKPVIATTVDGIKEMTGGGGVLEVTPGDENMLAAAMLSLARDNVLLLEMSNAALKTSQKFDIEPVITKIFVMLEN